MGLGNGNSNSGNKGSNFNYEFRALQLLGEMSAIAGAGATEATLQLVLSAIQSGSEFEAKLVRDNVGVTWLEVRTYDTATGTFNPPVYYPPGSNTPGSPTLPVSYIDATTLLSTIASNTTAIDNKLTSVTRTPSLIRASGAGVASVPAGARRVSFFNVGAADTTVLGATLKAGEYVSLIAGGEEDVLAAISYDPLTSELLISTIV